MALNGLRDSEATGASIEVLGIERGHRTLVVARKGGKVGTIPTLEPSLGVPGSGLRPGAGVLCRRDLGSGRRWRSGLVRCGIVADLGGVRDSPGIWRGLCTATVIHMSTAPLVHIYTGG